MNFPGLTLIQTELQKIARPIKLVAVTKYFDLKITQALIQAGVKVIGENRVEKAEEKFPFLPVSVEKHFIGQLQSKKLERIIRLFDVIQSVGSMEHLLKIDQVAQGLKKNFHVFLQFNISEEMQKGGFGLNQLEVVKEVLQKIHFIQVTGVMGMAQEGASELTLHQQFGKLREVRDELQKTSPQITELSMGMSEDYLIALQEEATVLRIGRRLLG